MEVSKKWRAPAVSLLFTLAMLAAGIVFVLGVFIPIVWMIYPDTKPDMVRQFDQWWRVNMPGPASTDTLLFVAWASMMWVLLDLRGLLQQIREELKAIRERINPAD